MFRFITSVLCLIALVTATDALSADSKPPNIVIILADDLGYGDLGSYGHPYNRTPNLDAMAKQGQRWTDFYVAAPVCSPSRGALLTGKLPTRTGLYGKQVNVMFPGDEHGIPDEELTLAEALQNRGYRTAIIGKWHLGDAAHAYPTRHGFDYWYGLPYSNDMDWVGHRTFDELGALMAEGDMAELQRELSGRFVKYFAPKVDYWNVPLIRSEAQGGAPVDAVLERPAHQPHLTRRYTEEAIAFIERNAEQPFLLYLPHTMPHTPLFRDQAFAGKSLGGRYGDVIEEIDWSTGEILRALRDQALAENTLVVFTSDNGPWLTMNQHGGTAGLLKEGKGTTFEGGMRVPGIFWWPGTIEPAVVSHLGSVMDLYATSLALAGAPLPEHLDAVDLTTTLQSGDASARDSLAYYRSGQLYAYRLGHHKLHLISEGAYQQPPERTVHDSPRLYDLRQDPAERFDIASTHPQRVEEMLAAIERHRASMTIKAPIFDARLAP